MWSLANRPSYTRPFLNVSRPCREKGDLGRAGKILLENRWEADVDSVFKGLGVLFLRYALLFLRYVTELNWVHR